MTKPTKTHLVACMLNYINPLDNELLSFNMVLSYQALGSASAGGLDNPDWGEVKSGIFFRHAEVIFPRRREMHVGLWH